MWQRIKNKLLVYNEKVAEKLADYLATMAMFYAISFLALLPLHFQLPIGVVSWAQYVLSVFFQGVALPVLAFVAKKEGNKTANLLQETHDATLKALEDQNAEIAEIKDLHKDLHAFMKAEKIPGVE